MDHSTKGISTAGISTAGAGPSGARTGELRLEDAVNGACPWSGKPVRADSLTLYRGAVVGFCNTGCRDKFEAAVTHFEAALAARKD